LLALHKKVSLGGGEGEYKDRKLEKMERNPGKGMECVNFLLRHGLEKYHLNHRSPGQKLV
jgi:hypothetical protein